MRKLNTFMVFIFVKKRHYVWFYIKDVFFLGDIC